MRSRIALGVFLCLLSVYLVSYSGHIHSIDEAHIIATTVSMEKGRLDVNQLAFYHPSFDRVSRVGTVGLSGDLFCKKGVATSLLAFPFVWMSKFVPGVGAVHLAHLTNGVITAATGSLVFLYLTTLGFSMQASLLSALTWGLGTMAWPYARLLFAEPVAALGLLAGFYGSALFRRRHLPGAALLSGLGFGLAVAAVPPSVLAFPFVVAGLLHTPATEGRRFQAAVGWMVGMALPALAMILYNLLRFGNPLDSGYRIGLLDFGLPFRGILGFLVSPGRGLIFYSPAVLLAVPGCLRIRLEHRAEIGRLSMLWLVFLLFFGSWRDWHGGWSWGPRYLVPLLPLLFPLIANVWESFHRLHPLWRGLILLVVGLSVLVQVIGVAGDYVNTEFILEREIGNQPDRWYYRGPQGLFHPLYSPLVVQARNLQPGTLDLAWMIDGRPDGAGIAAAGLALLLGGLALWAAWMPRPATRSLILCGAGLLFCAWILVARATEKSLRPFRGDGRLEALAFVSAHQAPGDALVSDSGYLYTLILDQYPHLPPAYILPGEQDFSVPLLNLALSRHDRIWFIGGYVIPGDPGRWIESWLSRNAFPLQRWDFAFYRLSLFSTPGEIIAAGDPEAVFGDIIRLKSFRLAQQRGQDQVVLQLTLYWEALQPINRDYQIFVHAYDPGLNLLVQADHVPVYGLRPTSSWRPGEPVEDRVAFYLPAERLETGFALAVGLYDLDSPGDRLPVRISQETSPDGRVWLITP